MNVNEIQAKLREVGVNAAIETIESHLAVKGIDPASVDDSKVLEIAQELQSSLAVSRPAGKATKAGAKGRNKHQSHKTGDGIAHLASQVQGEISAIQQAFDTGKAQMIEQVSDQIVAQIASTPADLLGEIGRKAQEFQGEPEFFRSEAERIASTLFGTYSTDAA